MNQNNDVDDFLEEFNLKPITDGLGFHHSIKEEKTIKSDLKSQSNNLKKEIDQKVKQLNKSSSQMNKSVQMGELAAFYATETPTVGQDLNSLISETPKIESDVKNYRSLAIERVIAWFIDIAIIAMTIGIVVGVTYFTSGISLDYADISILREDIALIGLVLFSVFYLFYFTVLDMTEFSTFGKRVMGIKLQSLGSRVSLFQSFGRSVLTLVSIPFLGMLSMLKLSDFITKTSVVAR